jgi:hypothetical protein
VGLGKRRGQESGKKPPNLAAFAFAPFLPVAVYVQMESLVLRGWWLLPALEGSFKQLIHPGILRASFHLYVFGN